MLVHHLLAFSVLETVLALINIYYYSLYQFYLDNTTYVIVLMCL